MSLAAPSTVLVSPVASTRPVLRPLAEIVAEAEPFRAELARRLAERDAKRATGARV